MELLTRCRACQDGVVLLDPHPRSTATAVRVSSPTQSIWRRDSYEIDSTEATAASAEGAPPRDRVICYKTLRRPRCM